MNLYLIHCGYYDNEICDGLYEGHVNYFIVAESFEDAKQKTKSLPEFQLKKMHIDGLQEIQKVEGYKIQLTKEDSNQTQIINFKHRDLAPKTK